MKKRSWDEIYGDLQKDLEHETINHKDASPNSPEFYHSLGWKEALESTKNLLEDLDCRELSASQKLSTQTIAHLEVESEKKLYMTQYITGKLLSMLVHHKYLTITETPTEDGKDILLEAKVKVVR